MSAIPTEARDGAGCVHCQVERVVNRTTLCLYLCTVLLKKMIFYLCNILVCLRDYVSHIYCLANSVQERGCLRERPEQIVRRKLDTRPHRTHWGYLNR